VERRRAEAKEHLARAGVEHGVSGEEGVSSRRIYEKSPQALKARPAITANVPTQKKDKGEHSVNKFVE